MHDKLLSLLACPMCSGSVVFEGTARERRFVEGFFKCSSGHVFQVKQQIGLLKDAKLSKNEFEWKVDVADEEKYLEIRREYDSYLRDDQKKAIDSMIEKLSGYVSRSSLRSDGVVLDVASGMGTFVLPLLEKSSPDSTVIGTDIDEKPLRGLMHRSIRAGTYDGLSLVVTDAKRLCFKSTVLSTVSSFFGFDNVTEADLALRECARVLRAGGRVFFVSLWLREESESMRLAEEYKVGRIASEGRLKDALDKSGLVLDRVEETYSGLWPHNPMDLLPVEGDAYAHVIVSARKPDS
jgi:ubiquinone/menaquinone biosynthesis C-methylase UbiE/uncharacterized protein YbaR (Trm112 family)